MSEANDVNELVMRTIDSMLKPGTEEYYLNGLHLAKVREQLGGVKARDSRMFEESIEGLMALGYSEHQVIDAVKKEFSA